MWWVGARERRKRAFSQPFIFSEWNFSNICVLSQCKVYWINFKNICPFPYQKTLLHTFFIFLKIAERLQCILNKRKEFTWKLFNLIVSLRCGHMSNSLKNDKKWDNALIKLTYCLISKIYLQKMKLWFSNFSFPVHYH